MSDIREGAPAPAFELRDHEDEPFGSKDLAGQPYVLWFYPKADTPGCTKEGCGFRDEAARFQERDIEIVGVSADAPAKQQRFKEKHRFPYRLLSDPDHALAEAYGVWVKKKLYGREYMGIDRATFLVDADGVIREIWRSVKVAGHVDEVLLATERMG
jgi:peroxiredoxin Q/BCP